jgi:hypothetical protein
MWCPSCDPVGPVGTASTDATRLRAHRIAQPPHTAGEPPAEPMIAYNGHCVKLGCLPKWPRRNVLATAPLIMEGLILN